MNGNVFTDTTTFRTENFAQAVLVRMLLACSRECRGFWVEALDNSYLLLPFIFDLLHFSSSLPNDTYSVSTLVSGSFDLASDPSTPLL